MFEAEAKIQMQSCSRTEGELVRTSEQNKHHKSAVELGKQGSVSAKLREACFHDYSNIAALHIRHGLYTRSFDDWSAFWYGNPALKEKTGHWPLGWVLETRNGEIVGSLTNLPLAYHFQGQEISAASACSWAVDTPYRGYSIFLMSHFLRQREVQLFISATVGPNAEGPLGVFQFSKIPVGNWKRSTFWITNYRGFVRSALASKAVAFAPALTCPVSAGLFCWDKLKFANRIEWDPFQIEAGTEFDSRFDEFWKELKRQNRNALLATRTRETLRWHFRDAMALRKIWVLTASKASRLVAYAIFERQDKAAFGLKRVRLVDFQAIDGCQSALHSALLWMLHKCRQESIHMLEVIGDWLCRPDIPEIKPPHRRPLTSWTYYYKINDPGLDRALTNPAVWAPSSYDGDASLYSDCGPERSGL